MKKLLIIITCLISLGVQGQDQTLSVRKTPTGTIFGLSPTAVRDTLFKATGTLTNNYFPRYNSTLKGLQLRSPAQVLSDIGGIGGAGSANRLALWNGASTVGYSDFFRYGTGVGENYVSIGGTGLGNKPPGDPQHIFNVINDAGTQQMMKFSTFGSSVYENNTHWFRAGGTEASPTQTLNNMIYFSEGLRGKSTTHFLSSNGAFYAQAMEDQTNSAQGVKYVFEAAPVGSNVRNKTLEITGLGLNVGGAINTPLGTGLAKMTSGTLGLAASSDFVSSIAGTTNQVVASAATGAVTLSLPQNIHTSATPTFTGLTLTGGGNGARVRAGASADNIKDGWIGADANFIYIGNYNTNRGVQIDQTTGISNILVGLSTPALKIPTGASPGYVLKSDASGNATWQATTSSYKGTWNASTNTPAVADGVGATGDYYEVAVSGTQFGRSFTAGGRAIYNGTIWEPVGVSASVTSVNGYTGVVVLAKSDVSLGNVDNTSDASKPVSTTQQAALDLKAPLASPALTGTPTAPTATAGTNTTQLATTAFVEAAVTASGGITRGMLVFTGDGSTTTFNTGLVESGSGPATILTVSPMSIQAGTHNYYLKTVAMGGGISNWYIEFLTAPAVGSNNTVFTYHLK